MDLVGLKAVCKIGLRYIQFFRFVIQNFFVHTAGESVFSETV